MANFNVIPKTITEILSETNSLRLLWGTIKKNLKAISDFLLRGDAKSQQHANNSIDSKSPWNRGIDFASFALYFLRLSITLGLFITDIKQGLKKIKHLKKTDPVAYKIERKKIISKAKDDYLKLMVNDIIWGVANFITSSFFAQILKASLGVTLGASMTYVGTALILVDVAIAVGFYFGRERKKYYKEKAAIEKKYLEDLENNIKEDVINKIKKDMNYDVRLAAAKSVKAKNAIKNDYLSELEAKADVNFKQKAQNERDFKLKKIAIEKSFNKNNMLVTVGATVAMAAAYALLLPMVSFPLFAVAAPVIALIAYTSITILSHINELKKLNKMIALHKEFKDKDLVDPELKKQFEEDYKKYVEHANLLQVQVGAKLSITAAASILFIAVGIMAPIFLPALPAIIALAAVGLFITIASIVANKLVDKYVDSKIKGRDNNKSLIVSDNDVNNAADLKKRSTLDLVKALELKQENANIVKPNDKLKDEKEDIRTHVPLRRTKSSPAFFAKGKTTKAKSDNVIANSFFNEYHPEKTLSYSKVEAPITKAQKSKSASSLL
jgi:hypothetical protein